MDLNCCIKPHNYKKSIRLIERNNFNNRVRMSISYRLLGKPGKDNALAVWINSGTAMHRILFDCGEDLLSGLKYSDIASVDYLFFSHYHLDHVSGFDFFLRRNYDRADKPVIIFGPADTVKVIRNHLSGYTWNLADGAAGEWRISEFDEEKIKTVFLKTSESYKRIHSRRKKKFAGNLIDNKDFSVDTVLLNHIIPSAGYRISEKPTYKIQKDRLNDLNLYPGPWLEKVKDLSVNGETKLCLGKRNYRVDFLRKNLLTVKKGDSIAYLTDFIYDRTSVNRAVKLISGCSTVFCESQYTDSDIRLAKKNFHLTARQAAEIARRAGVKKLILFHVSERYDTCTDYPRILNDARQTFENTFFPEEWHVVKNEIS